MSNRIEEIRAWHAAYMRGPRGGFAPYGSDVEDLLAEIDRLTAELAAERAAHELERRAHERTWKHKAKMIDERDAAIRERDALPYPSAETLEFIRCRIESYEAFGHDDQRRWRTAIDWVCDAEDALRAHAAGSDAKGGENG